MANNVLVLLTMMIHRVLQGVVIVTLGQLYPEYIVTTYCAGIYCSECVYILSELPQHCNRVLALYTVCQLTLLHTVFQLHTVCQFCTVRQLWTQCVSLIHCVSISHTICQFCTQLVCFSHNLSVLHRCVRFTHSVSVLYAVCQLLTQCFSC